MPLRVPLLAVMIVRSVEFFADAVTDERGCALPDVDPGSRRLMPTLFGFGGVVHRADMSRRECIPTPPPHDVHEDVAAPAAEPNNLSE